MGSISRQPRQDGPIDDGEQSRLSDWLCEFGDAGDLEVFNDVFCILVRVVEADMAQRQEERMAIGEVSETDEESPVDTPA